MDVQGICEVVVQRWTGRGAASLRRISPAAAAGVGETLFLAGAQEVSSLARADWGALPEKVQMSRGGVRREQGAGCEGGLAAPSRGPGAGGAAAGEGACVPRRLGRRTVRKLLPPGTWWAKVEGCWERWLLLGRRRWLSGREAPRMARGGG